MEMHDKSMIKYITLNRYKYSETTTIGTIVVEGIGKFGYTLEDAVRPYGIKIKTKTAIPENVKGYKVGLHRSNRFKRDMLILYTEYDRITLNFGGVTFTHIYIHGGNTHVDTEGCILVAKNVDEVNMKINYSLEKELFTIVKKWFDTGYEVRFIIKNNPYTDVR